MASLLEISDLSVSLETRAGSRGILTNNSLSIAPGDTVGVVGESGSGKTVLVRAILGLLEPQLRILGGRVMFQGRDLLEADEQQLQRIRGKDIALTTPEPRKHLNPLITVGRQIANVIRAHQDVDAKQAMMRAVELLNAVGIPDPEMRLAGYPHELSGGMCQRVIIAMALAHDSKLLLADEPTAGLDVTISRQILDLMHDLVRQHDTALLLVSRDLGVVAHYCRRVAVMYAGQIVEEADVETFFRQPIHPYSQHLLRAAAAARDHTQAASSSNSMLAPAAEGCAYASRCPIVAPGCREQPPGLDIDADGRGVRCWRQAQVVSGELTV